MAPAINLLNAQCPQNPQLSHDLVWYNVTIRMSPMCETNSLSQEMN